MPVYLDVVVILNFLVDFFLLLGTNRLSGFPPGAKSCALAAALGAVYSGVCLLPGFHFLMHTLWRVVILGLMGVVAFGWNRSAVRRGGVFLLLTMALGGAAMGMGGSNFWITVLSAAAIWLLCHVGFGGTAGQREYIPVQIRYAGNCVNTIALRDTGNTLRDPVTGEQVLVAGADIARKLTGLEPDQLLSPLETMVSRPLPGLRLIPYRSVGTPGGMLLAMRFRDIQIGSRRMDAVVAFAPEELGKGECYQVLTGGAI